MDTTDHSLSTLFSQLGLANDSGSIENFFANHALDNKMQLVDAPFWNTAQKQFIEESLETDADWSEQIDILDARLRHH